MRALLIIAMLATAAHAAPDDSLGMLGIEENGDKARGFMGVVIGNLSAETRGDDLGRSAARYGGWSYGLTMRGEFLGLSTAYGGRLGGTAELDVWLFTPGTLRRDDGEQKSPVEPTISWVFIGFTPAVALGVVKTSALDLSLELGTPVNTDFYGLSAGAVLRIKGFYLSYKVRSGVGWHGDTQVLDERIRIGRSTARSFVGIDITHGYSENEMSQAALRSIFKGGYTFISFIISGGR